jgi:serine/threonine protein kinase
VPPLFARRYDIATQLGSGGNGVVWKAHDNNLNRDVAIKFFAPGIPPGLVFREAQLHVTFAGPHVLSVYDASVYNDVPFIVSAIAPLGSAMDATFGTRGTTVGNAIRWTRHLLAGLDACHKNDLLHRDVKPANLFLMNPDTAALGDFGLLDRMVAGKAPNEGTEAFKPPEALASGTMDIQTDVYGAGLTAWMLLTGAHPFLTPTTGAAEYPNLIAQGVPRLRDVAPHIPSQLAKVVERSCAASRADRYATAAEMDQAFGGLPRFPRLWQEQPPLPGQHRAFLSTAKPSESFGFRVVVTSSGNRFDIETRKSGGSQMKSTSHCVTAVPQPHLPVRLRSIFNDLN